MKRKELDITRRGEEWREHRLVGALFPVRLFTIIRYAINKAYYTLRLGHVIVDFSSGGLLYSGKGKNVIKHFGNSTSRVRSKEGQNGKY